jgi:hypothetical protein
MPNVSYTVSNFMTLFEYMKKWRLREVRALVQGHRADKI